MFPFFLTIHFDKKCLSSIADVFLLLQKANLMVQEARLKTAQGELEKAQQELDDKEKELAEVRQKFDNAMKEKQVFIIIIIPNPFFPLFCCTIFLRLISPHFLNFSSLFIDW